MFDPFKRARSKAGKRMRRTTSKAVGNMWASMLTPTAPAKRKAAKASKPAVKKGEAVAKPRPVSVEKITARRAVPETSQSSLTVPRGASFKIVAHESTFGARSYKIYTPAIAKTTNSPLPLLVMLHGCGQTPQDFARGTGMNTLAEEFGLIVVYPAQSRDAHLNRCWNWFRRGDQARNTGEPALIAEMTRQIIADTAADPAKVYVAGLSAGAAAALIVANAYPDIFAAVGSHSGLPVGAAHDTASAVTAMRAGTPGLRHSVPMPTISFHGDADKVVHPRNGRFVASRALEPYERLAKTEKTGQSAGGRKYQKTAHRVGRGKAYIEHWVIEGGGHAWAGGNSAGNFTDPAGPDASRGMVRFFLRHRTTVKRRSAA